MATWSFTEYMDGTNYNPWYHASWSQYSVVLRASDTLSVRTIYNGGSSAATSVNYISAPNSSTTVNDPDPTTSDTGLDRTWSTSSFSNSNHHSRWFWFTSGVTAQASIRILTIPSTMGWSGVATPIEQGTSGNAVLTIPSSFEPYIQGTASETGDALSTNGTKQERFHWRIVSSTTSHTPVSAGFSSSSGDFIGPDSGDFVSISPGFSTPAGTYYIKLYFYDYNGNTGTNATTLDTGSFTVTAAAALDTTISLNSTSITTYSSDTYYTQSLTGGGSNTIYYIFNASNIANGSNLDALRTGGDSRYIARTFSTAASRPFSTSGSNTQITNDLPSSSNTSKTYYVYAANGNGQNSVKLSNTYTVTLTAVAPTVSATKAIITNGFGLYSNPTGTTSGTVTYQWSTNGGGPNSKSSYSTGYTSNQNLGVGTEWVGTTWTCQARATVDNGSTYVYSSTSSTTLPTYSVTAPTSIQEGQQGNFSNSSTNGLGPIYYQVTTASGGDFATSTGQIYTSTFGVTPTSDGITEGNETATVKLYINNTFNSLNYIYAEDTFLITDPPATPTAPVVSNTQTFAGTESATTTCTIALTSSGANGTLEYNVSTSTTVPTSGWQTSATVSVSRGTTYYFWARRGAGYEDRTDSAITVPYLSISDSSITLEVPTDKNGNALTANIAGVYVIPSSYGTSAGDNILIPYSNGGSVDQYRAVSNYTQNYWLDTQNGTSGTFVLEMNSSGGSYSELPAAGQTWEYEFEGRRRAQYGGDPSTADSVWVSVDGSQTRRLYRQPAATYSVSSPNSVNEGQTLTFTITTTNVVNGTTVAWTLSGGLQSGDYTTNDSSPATIQNNTATVVFNIVNDNVADGNKTATLTLASTDSNGDSTGSPSSSTTVVDTSNPGGGGTGGSTPGGSAGTYGLQILNSGGTQTIIDDTSRLTNFLASDSINTNSQSSKTMFTNFDCSDKTETGFIVTWSGALYSSPTITRRSSALGGITVTKNTNDTTSNTSGVAIIELVRY